MKNISTFLLLFAVVVLSACKTTNNAKSDGNTIYVSLSGKDSNIGSSAAPFKTIATALEYVKSHNDASYTINLLEGDYHLDASLVIDSELNNTTIIGQGKVTIKGSQIIETNWSEYNENIMVTDVDPNLDFNQLFINGDKQILARYPNFDKNIAHWNGYAADAIDKKRTVKWENPEGGFVHAMHRGGWGGMHYQITSMSKDGKLKLTGGYQNNRPDKMHVKHRMVDNIFEELDSTKEWYLDKKEHKLYVWKDENINLNKAKVEVTILKNLITIKGNIDQPVKNIIISNINFQHASRTFMEAYEPLLRSDWTMYRGGAILLEGTEQITIENCEFSNLGGNVVVVSKYNRNTNLIGNHIFECGASAISFVGDASAVRSPAFQYNTSIDFKDMDKNVGPKNELYPSDVFVENNLIHNIGTIEKQVAGVQISMAMKIHVKSNSIYDVPRAGINVGDGTWGGHIIEYNDVFNTVLETSDHGSFNSWGRDRFWNSNDAITKKMVKENPDMPLWDAIHTTIIRNNRFRCDHGWDIDLDDGSTNYEIYNNLCLTNGLKLREGYHRTDTNNIMVNNSFHPHVWFPNSHDIFKNNIVMTSYKYIRLEGWGDEVDYNLFTTEMGLKINKTKGKPVDKNSISGDPLFMNPKEGNFNVQPNSPAFKIGFKNFRMDKFGVQKATLKAIAKQPEIPELNLNIKERIKKTTRKWLNLTIKQISSIEEKSSYGTNDMSGVIVLDIDKMKTIPFTSLLKKGDVIVGIGTVRVKGLSHLSKVYKKLEQQKGLKVTVVRNQKEITLN